MKPSMKHCIAVLSIALLALPAAAQPIIIPLQRQRQAEPPPPQPSPVPVAPPQAAASPLAGQGAAGSVPGTSTAIRPGAGGDAAPRTAPQ